MKQAKIIVNKKPKLRHGVLTVRHPNGDVESIRLCNCCEEPK
jgi:hypothetical protein